MDRGNIRVAILEDELIIAESFRRILARQGYQTKALNETDAVRTIQEFRADLLLLDIHLKHTNGLNLLGKIYEHYEVPCIIVTGYCTDDLLQQANELGVFGYIVKPVTEKQILAAVDIALKRYEEYRQLKLEVRSTKEALAARKYIEKAKGILMKRYGLEEAEAMRELQNRSKRSNAKLLDMSKKIIAADELLG